MICQLLFNSVKNISLFFQKLQKVGRLFVLCLESETTRCQAWISSNHWRRFLWLSEARGG